MRQAGLLPVIYLLPLVNFFWAAKSESSGDSRLKFDWLNKCIILPTESWWFFFFWKLIPRYVPF